MQPFPRLLQGFTQFLVFFSPLEHFFFDCHGLSVSERSRLNSFHERLLLLIISTIYVDNQTRSDPDRATSVAASCCQSVPLKDLRKLRAFPADCLPAAS
jgi:hypothetical protein